MLLESCIAVNKRAEMLDKIYSKNIETQMNQNEVKMRY